MPRHASKHAAGVVITRLPVYDYVPLARNDDEHGDPVCDDHLGGAGSAEDGLFEPAQPDCAGRRAKSSSSGGSRTSSCPSCRTTTRRPLKCSMSGRTSGVFQMESAGMTGVCVQHEAAESIEDLTAIIALYRPGPMDSIPRFIACKLNPEPDPLPASQPGTHLVCHLRLHRLPGAGHR